ncbi:hypothetical protein BCV70DRAFT_201932 [Testicularia cyperi]|uniref:Zn(2)-C6 fungal-type domain-containing protein n=1 Tax=Testicularia cyperi TaxID=1882483 RepID=A0A317XJX6_9BASI|nr:hypothetical protein BCV70DRAFT_201932 [Testicularia cyperi]
MSGATTFASSSLPAAGGSSKKRPLAKRSCLECRAKKARCELPDLYVPSSSDPLPPEKRCHRCSVLDVDCVVYDGNRKRKPKLPPVQHGGASVPKSARLGQEANVRSRRDRSHGAVDKQSRVPPDDAYLGGGGGASGDLETDADGSAGEPEINGARAQTLLRRQKRGWTSLWRPFFVIVEKLQGSEEYKRCLLDKIVTEAVAIDLVFDQAAVGLWETRLEDRLVWHPYLPQLSAAYRQHHEKPTKSRALLLATLVLLACPDASSVDLRRRLCRLIDQLGIQLLLGLPREISLVMAFALLVQHEPGLVGVSMWQGSQDIGGFSMASENLLTCALMVARQLGIDQPPDARCSSRSASTSTQMAHASLWFSLRILEGHYAMLGQTKALRDMDDATAIKHLLLHVDDEGRPLELTPVTPSTELSDIQEGFARLERHLGRTGILRSAGRTLVYQRYVAMSKFHQSLCRLRDRVLGAGSLEVRRLAIVEDHDRDTAAADSLKAETKDFMRWFAKQRVVRIAEKWSCIETDFLTSLLCNYETAALFNGNMEGKVEASVFVEMIKNQSEPGAHVSKVGGARQKISHRVLAGLGTLGQQPRGTRGSAGLQLLPCLLTATIAMDACKQFLEATSFTLYAFGTIPQDHDTSLMLMQGAADCIRSLDGDGRANSLATVAADLTWDMIESTRQWQLFYSVYRHVPVSHEPSTTASAAAHHGSGNGNGNGNDNDNHPDLNVDTRSRSSPRTHSAMDKLAAAAVIASSPSKPANLDPLAPLAVNTQPAGPATQSSWDASSSEATPRNPDDVGLYNLSLPFDLDAFLKDIDQWF